MKKTVIAVVAAAGFAAPVMAQEASEIAMEDVPQAVMGAARAEAESAGVELTSVQLDDDEGTQTFELGGSMESGMGFEVNVMEDGSVQEVEEEIEMSEVPEAVAATLEENLAGFEPSSVERSTRDGGSTVVYEFEGSHDGGAVGVEINEDGSNYTMNENTGG